MVKEKISRKVMQKKIEIKSVVIELTYILNRYKKRNIVSYK